MFFCGYLFQFLFYFVGRGGEGSGLGNFLIYCKKYDNTASIAQITILNKISLFSFITLVGSTK